MSVYRFVIDDHMNEWAVSIEVEADDEAQARRRAEGYMFARRSVGDAEGSVRLEPDGHR